MDEYLLKNPHFRYSIIDLSSSLHEEIILWLSQLRINIQVLVKDDKITLLAAYALSKLHVAAQDLFVKDAMERDSTLFYREVEYRMTKRICPHCGKELKCCE